MAEESENEGMLLQMLTDTHQSLLLHRRDFAEHINDFDTFKRASHESMKKVSEIHNAFGAFAQNVSHLQTLPSIAGSLDGLKQNQHLQTRGLLTQNNNLVQTTIRSQRLLTNILIVVLVLVGAAMFVILLRESSKDLRVGGKNGIEISTPQNPVK